MIEVLFGESEAGSMTYAKQENLLSDNMDEAKVICLGFLLDIGHIEENIFSEYRKHLICSMYAQDQTEIGSETGLEAIGDFYIGEWNRMINYLNIGEEIRVWVSNSPYSMCGFAHLCYALEGYSNKLYTVKLPEYVKRDDTIIHYHGWGEVSPEDLGSFINNEHVLSASERRMYADTWRELVRDNSPLRVVINGQLLGAKEDFYDFLIDKQLTDKPIKQARLIGNILGYCPVGVGDWWYAFRINKLILEGKIKVAEDSKREYSRTIYRAHEAVLK